VNTTWEVCILITTLGILLIIFLGAQFSVFQKQSLSVCLSLFVILTLSATVFVSAHISSPSRPGDHVVPVFILVFAINTMMPLPRSVAILSSVVLAIVHLLLVVFISEDFVESLASQVSLHRSFILHQEVSLLSDLSY